MQFFWFDKVQVHCYLSNQKKPACSVVAAFSLGHARSSDIIKTPVWSFKLPRVAICTATN